MINSYNIKTIRGKITLIINFYKQLINRHFCFIFNTLVLIFYPIISYFNKFFRKKMFLFSTINGKSYEELMSYSNFVEISDIEIMIELSVIHKSNQIYLSKLKKFLADTQEEGEYIREVIQQNNYFVVLINIKKLFALYDEIFPYQIVRNDLTNESISKIFMSIDICMQYFFNLNKDDYLLKSLGLNLNYIDADMNNLEIWKQYSDIIEKRRTKKLKNQLKNIFDLPQLDNNPSVTCHYNISDYYDPEDYQDGKFSELALTIGRVNYFIYIVPTSISMDLLYFIITNFYFYLQPLNSKELDSLDFDNLKNLNLFILKNIKPLFFPYNKTILENKDKWNY